MEVSAGNPVTTLASNVSGNIHSKGFAIEAAVNDDNELEVTLTDTFDASVVTGFPADTSTLSSP